MGAAGATGLDYAGVRAYLDEVELDLSPAERRDAFVGIAACEAATLEVWADQRAAEADQPAPSPNPFGQR